MFCNNCGAQNPDNGVFCVSCGQSLQQAAPAQPPQQEYYQQQAQYQQAPQAEAPVDEAQDAQNNKLMGILSYIIFFIPLITGDTKKSPFVKFHCNQGTVLWIAGICYSIAQAIISAIFRAIFHYGVVSSIISTLLSLVSIVFLVLAIVGILSANKGEKKPLPVIGGFTIIK